MNCSVSRYICKKNGINASLALQKKAKKYIIVLVFIFFFVFLLVKAFHFLRKDKRVLNKEAFSESQKDEIISAELPSLPYVSWKHNKDKKVNLKCGEYPSILKVPFYNTYWQTLKSGQLTVQLFGAYYDNRPVFGSKAYVRLYALIDAYLPNMTTHYCQMWFDEQQEPVVAKIFDSSYSFNADWGQSDKQGGQFEPYLLSCEVPTTHLRLTPKSVTLATRPCEKSKNHLKVFNERPGLAERKSEFGVCVRNALFPFEDMSIRYIEWIEVQLALGASKIYFYVMDVHPNIAKVFQYYEKLGKVHVSYMTYPTGHPRVRGLQLEYQQLENIRTMRWELIALNDCYYRNMYKHEYLAVVDPDEVLMPKMDFQNWHELLANVTEHFQLQKQTVDAFNFVHSYFLGDNNEQPHKDLPEYMYMLQHTDKIAEYAPIWLHNKCFHSTANTLLVHNHFPLKCVNDWCNTYYLSTDFAQLNHYRRDCHRWNGQCDVSNMTTVTDLNLWKHKKQVLDRTEKTMAELGFLG